jgi:hypothetical protein
MNKSVLFRMTPRWSRGHGLAAFIIGTALVGCGGGTSEGASLSAAGVGGASIQAAAKGSGSTSVSLASSAEAVSMAEIDPACKRLIPPELRQGAGSGGSESTKAESPIVIGLPAGSKVNMLWVGNSLTNTAPDFNNYELGPMPERLKPMLAEFGIKLTSSYRLQSGAEFSDHAKNPDVMAALADPVYDIVNLQGYYEGFSSAEAYRQAVDPLYDAARGARSKVLFEEVWSFRGDPGSPQFPTAAYAVERASFVLPGSFPVLVMRAWEQVRDRNAALYDRLYSDNTHQSKIGEYLNTLAYTRFFSGKSVLGVKSIDPLTAKEVSEADRLTLKTAVDVGVSVFYSPNGRAVCKKQ